MSHRVTGLRKADEHSAYEFWPRDAIMNLPVTDATCPAIRMSKTPKTNREISSIVVAIQTEIVYDIA